MLRWVAVVLLTLVVVCLLWSLARSALMGQAVAVSSVSAVLPLAAPAAPSGSSSVVGRPSLSAAFINRVLAAYGSPARWSGASDGCR